MPFPNPMPHYWLLDACCALNLAASGNMEAILRAPINGGVLQFLMTTMVVGEATSLRRGGSGDNAEMRDIFDWEIHFSSGLLQRTNAENPDELSRYVSLAQFLDDGEAMCVALAAARVWGVVTDDIAAQKKMGSVPFLTTPELIKNWAEFSSVDSTVLAGTLRRIREKARYGPPRIHPLHTWWTHAFNSQ